MPSFEKSPADLVARFEAVAPRFAGAQRRQMFGYPCLFVHGNLVTGLHEGSWMVRLPDDERRELLALPGAGPFEPMPGRPMKGYAVLPAAVVADDAQLEAWLRRAIAYGGSLPPKG